MFLKTTRSLVLFTMKTLELYMIAFFRSVIFSFLCEEKIGGLNGFATHAIATMLKL